MTAPQLQAHHDLAQRLAGRYAALPMVQAVAVAGSLTTGRAKANSDIDLYVYSREPVPVPDRAAVASDASQAEIDNQYWESGDEWLDAATGIHVDVMFRTMDWTAGEIDRVLVRHGAWVGYTTAIWFNVQTSQALFDRKGWFAALQARADVPYPEPLVRAIVAKNHPILRETLSSYRYQLDRAVSRRDWVSLNHRAAAVLASYFDILFAVNRQPHPGEKRLLAFALETCAKRPPQMAAQVEALLAAAALVATDPSAADPSAAGEGNPVLAALDALVDGLDDLLRDEGLWRG